ncbi:hypothetical protein [Niallia nealsonii]|uniref:Rod shape-determining protein MreD n=1 Tax=Niallia nealsonii TaxID=115979 RepID=A0A2N0Z7V9_9BACI|nr:hypothetical protein [Niallia nealsonii]PKG25601.1 hypothetical protein CWS01_01795 [Niallia nealsonii]
MLLVFISIFLLAFTAIWVPKRISQIEIYATSFFAYSFGITTDIILNFKYDLYGYGQEGAQIYTTLCIIAVYFSINILYLNFFPLSKNFLYKILYVAIWSLFSILYELFIVHTDMFYYNGWKLWHSAFLYPIIFSILFFNWMAVKKLLFKYIQKQI